MTTRPRTLVTGGAGFLGSHLCDRLLQAGHCRAQGTPETLDTDQASQFTSLCRPRTTTRIQLSMNGKGAWRDHLFVERLWKSVKYEEVYLPAYASVSEAQRGLGRYFTFYNAGRPSTALEGRTPAPKNR